MFQHYFNVQIKPV